MEKITKKRFREIIENNKTANIGRLPIERFPLDKVDEFVTDERVAKIDAPFWRTVESKQTNSIMFSDKSWLEFKSGTQYYQRGNLLFMHIPNWQTIVYLVA